MKIIHVINYFQPKLGYQEYYFAKIAEEFKETSYVITSERYFPFPNYEKTIYPILGNRYLKTGNYIEYGLRTIRLAPLLGFEYSSQLFLPKLRYYIKKIKPDVVYLHGLFNFHLPFLAKLKKKMNFVLIVDSHGIQKDDVNFFKKIMKSFFYNIIIPKNSKCIDGLIVTSKDLKKYHSKRIKNRTFELSVLPLGADKKIFHPMYDKRLSLRSKFSIPPNEIVLLYSGKIIEDKGIEKIIKIGKKWKEKSNFSLTLVLIGSGKVSYINFLRNKTSKAQINFKYFTGVSHKDLPLYFNLANFCFWIGSPSISMYEAAMCGIPIVISRNSKRGFVARNTHGFVFDDNYDEVVNWLNENSDAIVWHKLSEDVFNQAEALYTWEKIYLRLKNKFFPN